MLDVTDDAFRQMITDCKKPSVLFTEFVSVDGLRNAIARPKLVKRYLRFHQSQRPIVAQLWGSNPLHFEYAAALIKDLGFDGIDINMGCPDKSVVKSGGGAALIITPKIAKACLDATRSGAGNLPVSVKTRIGFNTIETTRWITQLSRMRPDAITIHGRTKKELSLVSAHWNEIKKGARIARQEGIVVLGNGDVTSMAQAKEYSERYSVDGIMIGRALLGTPWFFKYETPDVVSFDSRIALMLAHARLFEKQCGDIKSFAHIRKHLKGYLSDFRGAKELRTIIMKAQNARELKKLAYDWKKSKKSN